MMLIRRNRPNLLETFFNDDFLSNSLLSDSFFNEPFGNNLPESNWDETDENYIMELALPGMTKDDLSIEVDGNYLTISSNVEEKDEKSWYKKSFSKSVSLGSSIDKEKISSEMKDGILKLYFPKNEKEKKLKRLIEIK
jgi:HSP20 family protein